MPQSYRYLSESSTSKPGAELGKRLGRGREAEARTGRVGKQRVYAHVDRL